MFYAGKVEGKEFFTYKVKVKRRHGETSQLALSDKDNMSEIEGRQCGETSTTNFTIWDCTHYKTEIM
jgi:hypothetical protein